MCAAHYGLASRSEDHSSPIYTATHKTSIHSRCHRSKTRHTSRGSSCNVLAGPCGSLVLCACSTGSTSSVHGTAHATGQAHSEIGRWAVPLPLTSPCCSPGTGAPWPPTCPPSLCHLPAGGRRGSHLALDGAWVAVCMGRCRRRVRRVSSRSLGNKVSSLCPCKRAANSVSRQGRGGACGGATPQSRCGDRVVPPPRLLLTSQLNATCQLFRGPGPRSGGAVRPFLRLQSF